MKTYGVVYINLKALLTLTLENFWF